MAISGGGAAACRFAIGVSLRMKELGMKMDMLCGCSGGALASNLLSRFEPDKAGEFMDQFKTTKDVYKLNFVLRLFGWVGIKNGLNNYDGLRKALNKIDKIPTTPAFIELYNMNTGKLSTFSGHDTLVKSHLTDLTISSMSILGLVETEDKYCDPGVLNVLPLHSIDHLARPGDVVYLVEAGHYELPQITEDMKWKDRLMLLPAITAYNTFQDDLIALRKMASEGEFSVVELRARKNLDVYDFSAKVGKIAELHGWEVAREILG